MTRELVSSLEASSWVHVTFGAAESGGVKNALGDLDCIAMDDDLGFGPLNTVSARTRWWITFYKSSHSRETYDNDRKQIAKFIKCVREKRKVMIWAGRSAAHQVGLRRLLALAPSTLPIWTAYSAPFYSQEKILKSWEERRKLTSAEHKRFFREWHLLKRDKNDLRIVKIDGTVVSLGADHYDLDLAALCGSDFTKAPRIVGEYLARHASVRSVEFLIWRLQCLVHQGWLDAEGDVKVFSKFSVRQGSRLQNDLTV